MCDTVVVVGDGGVRFAKNSDRDPNEAQTLEWHAAADHADGASVDCTWITIPQARHTAAVLLSRPFWMWGAEMGANEHGVVIGNEAVFTTEPEEATGLTGMDLLRLALERARTVDEAVGVIVELLETHGQGGGCGFEDPTFTYHNSFLVADASGATVLETAGRRWATERVVGVRSISNGLTIPGFADAHADPERTRSSACAVRRARTEELGADARGPADLARVLRDHGGSPWPVYARDRGSIAMPCMHGGGEGRSPVTAGSWISELAADRTARHWATGTSSPCLGLFVPVEVGTPVDLGPPPGSGADGSLWWTHERLHRRVMTDPERLAPPIVAARDALEADWFTDPAPATSAMAHRRRLADEWLAALPEPDTVADGRPPWTQRFWAARNRAAGI